MARRSRRKARNAPRRARRHARRSSRRSSRRYYHNPGLPSRDVLLAIAVAALGYLAAEAATKQIAPRLPRMVPQPDLVGAALASALIGYGASYLPVSSDSKRAAALGAGIPTVKALANAVGLGNILGTAPVIMYAVPRSAGSLPAPLSAALNAQLEAALNGNMDDSYSPDY